MVIYCISGLAADSRIFENVTFPDSIPVKHIHWIEPLKNESFHHYCTRLTAQMNAGEDCILIGVSLGGIAAVELNTIVHPKKIILISSVSTRSELPSSYRFISKLRLQQLLPAVVYKWYHPLINWLFGAVSKREKESLKYYMKKATSNYMKWAINAVVTWKNDTRPGNLLHIQGALDKIFPAQNVKADIVLKEAGHLMVHNRAIEISRIINNELTQIKGS